MWSWTAFHSFLFIFSFVFLSFFFPHVQYAVYASKCSPWEHPLISPLKGQTDSLVNLVDADAAGCLRCKHRKLQERRIYLTAVLCSFSAPNSSTNVTFEVSLDSSAVALFWIFSLIMAHDKLIPLLPSSHSFLSHACSRLSFLQANKSQKACSRLGNEH